MTGAEMTSPFDAAALAANFREHGIVELDRPADCLAPGQRGRAAALAMNVIAAMWLAGLGDELSHWLDVASEWIERDVAELGEQDPDGWVGLRRRYRALAIARWLQDRDDPLLWHKAAAANLKVPFSTDPEDQADIVPPGIPAVIKSSSEPSATSIWQIGQIDVGGDISIADVGAYISEYASGWLSRGAYIQLASWLHFGVTAISRKPSHALEIGRFLVPELRVRNGSKSEGNDHLGRRNAVVTAPRQAESLDPLFLLIGLSRDTDAVPPAGPPEFASWTYRSGRSLEVDWHSAKDRPARLEIRGDGAGRLAALVTAIFGGWMAAEPETALANLLTVPRRMVPASPAAADARWEILCLALHNDRALDQMGGRALVIAGLADSDWRSRMAAVWAVGHFRLADLAPEAEAAALPDPNSSLLSQDDRRVLLAMRDLAAARSAGHPDLAKSGSNVGFVQRIASLLDEIPRQPEDRAERLVAALLRRGGVDPAAVPSAWKRWLT